MCTYVGCVERDKSSAVPVHQQDQTQLHSGNYPQQQGMSRMDVEMNHSQGHHSNGTYLPGGRECNGMEIHQTETNDHNNSTTNNNQPSGTCSTCHINWRLQSYTPGCAECDGFALIRSCPICNGRCGALWGRDINMSNEMKAPFWDGDCRLPKEEQDALMIRQFVSDDMDTLADAFGDL